MLDFTIDSKKAAILNAAFQVFMDYGFKRATMDDIARVAGMSRPALYLVYKNKKDIFRGCILTMIEQLQQTLEGIVENGDPPEENVYRILEAGILQPYHLLKHTAHGTEIFDIKSELAPDLFDDWMQRLESAVVKILQKARVDGTLTLDDASVDVDQVAALIIDGAEGAKLRMTEEGDLSAKLHSLVRLVLRPLMR